MAGAKCRRHLARRNQPVQNVLGIPKKPVSYTHLFDNKIAAVKEKIAKLEAKKKDVLTPKKHKPRKSKADQIKLLVKQAHHQCQSSIYTILYLIDSQQFLTAKFCKPIAAILQSCCSGTAN